MRSYSTRSKSDRIDHAAVALACRGRATHLHPAERLEAVRTLTEVGHSAREIAELLQCTERSVVRLRSFARSAA